MHKHIKIISISLIFTLLFTLIPTPTLAKALMDSINEQKIINTPPMEDVKKPEPKIVNEVTEKREKFTKSFRLDNGNFEAAQYPIAIHYLNQGKWKDIDNTLVDAVDEENNPVVQNKENSYRIKIAKSSKSNKLVRVQKDKYEVSWNLNDAQQSLSSVKPVDTSELNSLSENEKKMAMIKLTSEVNFNDIVPNTNLQYLVKPEEIKENIIIKSKTDSSVYTFNLNVKNLTAKLQNDKSIIFYDSEDTKKAVFKIDAPSMYDSAKNESSNIEVVLNQNDTGYTMTLIPDQQWLNSEDRAYPVILDPSISTSTTDTTCISDASITSASPASNLANSSILKTGTGTGIGTFRTYVKFSTLPTLHSGDMIYDAYFKALHYNSNTNPVQINVHRVITSWDESTITWDWSNDHTPTYNTKIEDYQMVKDMYVQNAWDITAMVKDWYNTGVNNGLMLKSDNESADSYCEFVSSESSSVYQDVRPQLTIFYTNNAGLEDYWTYHSQDVGRAGTGYVNDYNGNLVFAHSDLEMTGNKMPISISHVYNSNDTDPDTNVDTDADILDTNHHYGKGWRLNLSQSVKYIKKDNIEYYVYTDEDGTKHYLKSDNTGKYKDESGLNIVLTPNTDGTYTITDKKDNELLFTSFAKLKSIKDNKGNILTLNYNGSNVLESAVDGAGRKTTFQLTADAYYLIGITDPNGRKTNFSYNGILLTKIVYPDGKQTIYSYDTNNKLVSAVNYDGYKMEYQYCPGKPYRVKGVQEYGSDGSPGQSLSLEYGYNTTKFTDKSGRKNIYQFNTSGNTVSVRDDDGSAQYCTYFTDDNAAKNKLESTSRLQKTVMNYLKNHNIETSTDWTGGNWTGSTGSYTISTTQSYLGKQSLTVSKTNDISRHFYGQTLNLEKGKTYTFSGYIKTGETTNAITNTHGKGAALFVNYQNSAGAWQTVESNYANGAKGWDRYMVTFTVPADASSTMVYLRAGVIEEKGTAYFDCLQLEDGKIANRYNLVENADFSNGMTGWTKNTYTDSNDLLRTVGGAPGIDANAFELTGNASKSKNFYQIINVSGNAGDVFSIGGWAKGQSVPTSNGSGRYYALDIGLRQAGTSTYQYKVVHFNEDSTDWQYASDMIKANFAYDQIIVYGLYYNNANYAFFDGIQMYKEEFSESYVVNPDTGNLESTKNVAERNSTFNYNAKNELISYTDPKGSTYTYDYKDANDKETYNLYKATTAENVVYSFDYDGDGNPIKASVGTASSVVFTATATYSESIAATETQPEIKAGNYIASVTDYDGNTTTYNYNQMKGTLDSVTDAKGNTTSYSYDNLDRLTSASSQGITNNYTYTNDRLTKITHNGFSYVFDYDSYGRVSKVGIDGRTEKLITNTYDNDTGNLTASTYGNGDVAGMEYDNLDRVETLKYGKGTVLNDRYRFEYDASGNLGYEEDLENNVNYRYTYDLADRLTKVVDSNNNTLTYSFDKNSNVSNFNETVNGQNHSIGYTYDKDNKITAILLGTDNTITYSYDIIGRLTKETVKIGTTSFTTSYTYTDANGVNKAKLQKLSLPNGREISYTYDKNNNITSIQEGSKTVSYFYDGLNQLIRENNGFIGTAGKTITYSYDAGGNILSKTEYPLTTGDNLPTAVKTYEYKYDKVADGGTGWNDKLVKIIITENGTPTTYDLTCDSVGNLTKYNGYTYTWEGRQLRGITGNGKNISFKYNSSGIRTEKDVDGNVTKYHLVGDEVTYEETKDSSGNVINKIYYIYDDDDELVAMVLNGIQYNYIRNAQGDIIGLLDSTGKEVVSYTYDSWGKLESISGTEASTVGVANPYIYRGYRYDTETGLYYLQSRYYNPEWSRFINADALVGQIGTLLSHNIFAYCSNNPINFNDKSGFQCYYISEKGAGGCAVVAPIPDIGEGLMCFVKGCYYACAGTIGAVGGYIYSASSKSKSKGATKSKKGNKKSNNNRKKGVGGKGWRGDATWKADVNSVKKGGTITNLNGQIPTQEEAEDLISESGGRVDRIEPGHNAPNPHNYNHINYTTKSGIKGTIRIK